MDDTIRTQLATVEMDVLRKELQGLKECQIKFLNTAPVATGLLFGLPQLVAKTGGTDLPLYVGALLPLVVLIPAWWTFFDKARSITRIVGYYRVLEATVRGDFSPVWFPGWERALEAFRRLSSRDALASVFASQQELWPALSDDEKAVFYRRFWQNQSEQPPLVQSASACSAPEASRMWRWRNRAWRVCRVITLQERQRYWLIAFGMFLWLSILAVTLSGYLLYSRSGFSSWHWVNVAIASAVVVWSARCNASALSELMWGSNSYLANQIIWSWLLRGNGASGPIEVYVTSREELGSG